LFGKELCEGGDRRLPLAPFLLAVIKDPDVRASKRALVKWIYFRVGRDPGITRPNLPRRPNDKRALQGDS